MKDVCREMGVRTDVPFRDLKDIVYHGPAEKKHIFYRQELRIRPASWTLPITMPSHAENALARSKDDKGMKRIQKFLREDVCPGVRSRLISGQRVRQKLQRHLAEPKPAR